MRNSVAVIRGGQSAGYEGSLKSGAHVLQHIDHERFAPKDIFIDRSGAWYHRGIPQTPEQALRGVDVAMVAGADEAFGDPGTLRAVRELGVPHVGPSHQDLARLSHRSGILDQLAELGISVPYRRVVATEGDIDVTASELFRSFPQPSLLRIVSLGEAHVATHYDALRWVMARAHDVKSPLLAEEYIPGKVVTMGVVDGFRGQRHYALMPLEAIDQGRYQVPARIDNTHKRQLADLARAVRIELDLPHFSNIDFTIGKRRLYFKDIDPTPSLAADARFTHALQAVGTSPKDFLTHIFSFA